MHVGLPKQYNKSNLKQKKIFALKLFIDPLYQIIQWYMITN